jgi:hypothetical protein
MSMDIGDQGIEVPDADPTLPGLHKGKRDDPADTTLPPEPQDESVGGDVGGDVR